MVQDGQAGVRRLRWPGLRPLSERTLDDWWNLGFDAFFASKLARPNQPLPTDTNPEAAWKSGRTWAYRYSHNIRMKGKHDQTPPRQ